MQKLYIFLGNAAEQRYHKFYYYKKKKIETNILA